MEFVCLIKWQTKEGKSIENRTPSDMAARHGPARHCSCARLPGHVANGRLLLDVLRFQFVKTISSSPEEAKKGEGVCRVLIS